MKRFRSDRKTDQCTNCQSFDHHAVRCKYESRCRICAASHNTRQHVCTKCRKTAQKCTHIKTLCVNCKKSHRADDKNCEMMIAIHQSITTDNNTQQDTEMNE